MPRLLPLFATVLTLLLSMADATAQRQLGEDISTELGEGWRRVAMSADGLTVIVGAPEFDGVGEASGRTAVYTFREGAWRQLGGYIDGEGAGDYCGWGVDINAAGTRIAVGAPEGVLAWPEYGAPTTGRGYVRIFDLVQGQWQQAGPTLEGDAGGDCFGQAVTLDSVGNRLGAGAPGHGTEGENTGMVRVYDLTRQPRVQLGGDILGEIFEGTWGRQANSRAGHSVDLARDGGKIIVGSPGYTFITESQCSGTRGLAYVYELNTGGWGRVGNNIGSYCRDLAAGVNVAINSPGDRSFVSAQGFGADSRLGGYVMTRDLEGSTWGGAVVISDQLARGSRERYRTVAINSSGNRVVIGDPYAQSVNQLPDGGRETRFGAVVVFERMSEALDWVQLGEPLYGAVRRIDESVGFYQIGSSLAMNASGSTFAAGILDASLVRVYTFDEVLPVSLTSFTAQPRVSDIALAWTTTAERGASHFLLEHARDGRMWRALATVSATAPDGLGADYAFTHASPGSGAHYYRLTAVDLDGTTEAFDVATATLADSDAYAVALYPNPSAVEQVTLAGRDLAGARLTLYDAVGRRALTHVIADGRAPHVDIARLSPGLYQATVLRPGFGVSHTTLLVE